MEIHMARAEAEAATGRYDLNRLCRAIAQVECTQGARVLGLVRLGVVATVHDQHRAAGREHHHLMRVDAEVRLRILRDLIQHAAIRVQPVHRQVALAEVVRIDREPAVGVHAHVNRALAQRHRLAEGLERAIRPDAKRAQVIAVGRDARTAAAGADVEHRQQRMPPRVLHLRRQRDRGALGERGTIDVDRPAGQHLVHGAVEIRAAHGAMGVNIGTAVPFSEWRNTTCTRCPMRTVSRSVPTILVITVGPSSSVT